MWRDAGCFTRVDGVAGEVALTPDETSELRALINSADVPSTVGTRARIVLWYAENRAKTEISQLSGLSRPTVDLWLGRHAAEGVAGLLDRSHAAPREQVPARIRARVLSLTRTSPCLLTSHPHGSATVGMRRPSTMYRLRSSNPIVAPAQTRRWGR